jgi:hypothetical protein
MLQCWMPGGSLTFRPLLALRSQHLPLLRHAYAVVYEFCALLPLFAPPPCQARPGHTHSMSR